jgi:HSP20 family protein
MTTTMGPFPFSMAFEPFLEPFLEMAHNHTARYSHAHAHAHNRQRDQHNNNNNAKKQTAAAPRKEAAAAHAPAPAPAAPRLPPALKPSVVIPACNIYETNAAYWIQLDMPGAVDPEVVAQADKLTVTADASGAPPALPEGARLLRRERPRAARYERTFTLPDGGLVDTDGIEARLDAGVLTIQLPKVAPKQPEVKRIRVVGGGGGAAAAAAAAAAEPAAPDAPTKKSNKVVRIAVEEKDEDDDEGSVEDASDEEKMEA